MPNIYLKGETNKTKFSFDELMLICKYKNGIWTQKMKFFLAFSSLQNYKILKVPGLKKCKIYK